MTTEITAGALAALLAALHPHGRDLYCDVGVHAGMMQVRLEGYLTVEQYSLLTNIRRRGGADRPSGHPTNSGFDPTDPPRPAQHPACPAGPASQGRNPWPHVRR